MRKICYVTGNRADFGLMVSTLRMLANHPEVDLSLCVTGMHLSATFGNTLQEITAEKLRICGCIPVDLEASNAETMAKAIGHELIGMIDIFQKEAPDVVMLLGDRGEMLAGAIAAVHLNIPIVHIHGGERSGTVDEMVRHAISKFAHYHFVATDKARQRLIQMGEVTSNVFVAGAPGLDGLNTLQLLSKAELCHTVKFDPSRKIALFLFHPVVQEITTIAAQTNSILEAALAEELQLICLLPNADAGGIKIRETLQLAADHSDVRLFSHLPRLDYLAWLAAADMMLGNSSSAIIEAASFNLMAINVGSRQNLRERGENVIDVVPDSAKIQATIRHILTLGKQPRHNLYGDGNAGIRIVEWLTTLPLTQKLLQKANAY